jgi:hypothetical protein
MGMYSNTTWGCQSLCGQGKIGNKISKKKKKTISFFKTKTILILF